MRERQVSADSQQQPGPLHSFYYQHSAEVTVCDAMEEITLKENVNCDCPQVHTFLTCNVFYSENNTEVKS